MQQDFETGTRLSRMCFYVTVTLLSFHTLEQIARFGIQA